MNMFKTVAAAAVFGLASLGANAATISAGELSSYLFAEISTAVGEISQRIATEASAQLRSALQAPRPERVRKSPSVTVSEGGVAMVVEASRLPPLDGRRDARVRAAGNGDSQYARVRL